jgi:biofilm PGA synthesis N-glycosyltransferase PgaC
MQYMGMAAAGKPYMGVGRNLAYRKTVFFNNKGFASHSNLYSGDDDLFVNETANSENVAMEMHPDSFTWSDAETSFKNWYIQKKRHLTTGPRYTFKTKFKLLMENISRFLFLASFIYLLFFYPVKLHILIIFVILLILKGIIYKIVFTRLKEGNLFLTSPVIDLIMPVFYGFIHLSNLFERKRKQWN